MSIGIKFKIKNEYGNYLKQILDNINNANYIWRISEDEVYVSDGVNEGFLFPQERSILTNTEFINIISKELYYTVFANIKLYIKEDEDIINNYTDLSESSCILVLIITDNEFVEVYSKDKKILDIIYRNAINYNFSDIRYITKENFNREKLSPYSD